jgi:hypothetical protein
VSGFLLLLAALPCAGWKVARGATEAADPQAQIKEAVAKVTEKAGQRAMAFVLRPDTGGAGLDESPSLL